jgi:predicted CopG family antitoxin
MPKTSIYLDEETYQRAEQMTRIEERSLSNFISLLLNREWRRNFQISENTHAPAEFVTTESISPESQA